MAFLRFLVILFIASVRLCAETELASFDEDNLPTFDEPIEYESIEYAKQPKKKQDKPAHSIADIDKLQLELSAEAEPLTTVAGCVNISSGHLFFIDQDIIGHTINPLHFIRYYDSGSKVESMLGFGNGSQFPLWASKPQTSVRHHYASISEREGALVSYEGRTDTSLFSIDRRVLSKGYTNLNRSVVGGKANFVNWKASYREHPRNKEPFWKVKLGDGSRRYYSRCFKVDKNIRELIGLPTKKGYLLNREVLANGNELHYSYELHYGLPLLREVKTLNRTKTAVLNTLNFSYQNGLCSVKSSCGDSVDYHLKHKPYRSIQHVLTKQNLFDPIGYDIQNLRKSLETFYSSEKGKIDYETIRETSYRKISKVNKPNGRFIKVKYGEGLWQDGEDKVHTLTEPLGPNGEETPSCRLAYAKHHTIAFDPYDQPVLYIFDTNRRLIRRNYLSGGYPVQQNFDDFLKKRHTFRQDFFEWSTKEGEEGWLRSKSVGKGNQIYHRKSYGYDPRGNVIRNTVYGNLTGEKGETFEDKRQTDHYSISYDYSTDGRNLLTEKRTPEGWTTRYSYLQGTNLPVRILHLYEGKIQEREFFEYDDNGQIKLAIEDNGCGEEEWDLTDHNYRKMKFIQAFSITGHPAFGKPQTVTEGYRENQTGGFVQLKRTDYSYDDRGNEIGQRIFVDDLFCYETKKQYDERRRLIEESNAVGETTRYAYDENNNKIEESLLGSGKTIYYSYDLMNRLTKKREHHSNGRIASTTYQYDLLSHLVAETDSYGNTTTHSYDRLGNRICTVKPLIHCQDDQLVQPTIRKTFNLLGQMTSQTDENGFTTHFSYNIYGNPIKITYSDGATEHFIYYLNGKLKQKWFADGISVRYRYDAKGHLTEEEMVDQHGQTLKVERYTYKGPLLISKTDAMGFVTHYHYDCAGRKISENFHNNTQLITYTYDGLNRMTSKTHHGDNAQVEFYRYDGLDRVVEKKLQDQGGIVYGQESYHYDIFGNRVLKEIQQTEDQSACYNASYHSDQTLDWKSDPLNNTTHWIYNHRHTNGIGQIVQCRACIDPMGRRIHEADDALFQIARRDIVCNDMPYSTVHFAYDPKGQKIQEHTIVTVEGVPLREYVVRWEYNSRGWKVAETELPHHKRTTFDYDSCGRLIRRTKPDGVSLHYCYNGLGQLISKHSSDDTINYTYEYDLHGNPLKINDNVHHVAHHRKYDPLDRLIEEEITPSVKLQYSYDPFNRLTGVHLPDGSSITYFYEGYHLRTVNRHHPDGQLAYSCCCPSYDKRGQLLKSVTPAGTTNFTYDLLGRPIQIDASHWSGSSPLFSKRFHA